MPVFVSAKALLVPSSVSLLSPSSPSPRLNPISLVRMCQWFAPSRLVITFEHDGHGAFPIDEIRDMVVRGRNGRVLRLNLPSKSILIANHQVRIRFSAVTSPLTNFQVYADWWYAWC